MTGLPERPSRQPRENRKAAPRESFSREPSIYGSERAALALFYAAKIAAAQLYAPKHLVAAIIAAIRAEERAAASALRERHRFEAERKRRRRSAWVSAARETTRRQEGTDPLRPLSELVRSTRRERRHE